MPHDLQHFIVERELGIKHGIFGFLAAGGEASGNPHEVGRAASRRRRKAKRRDERMKRRGARAEGDASEHAAGFCWDDERELCSRLPRCAFVARDPFGVCETRLIRRRIAMAPPVSVAEPNRATIRPAIQREHVAIVVIAGVAQTPPARCYRRTIGHRACRQDLAIRPAVLCSPGSCEAPCRCMPSFAASRSLLR